MNAAMRQEKRALERIERQLRERWPDLYMKADPSVLVLKLYGTEGKLTEQLAMARKLATTAAIELVCQSEVMCSQSAPFTPSSRPIGEPSGTQPKMVGEDDRGVALFCDSTDTYSHDWSDYEPLNPHLF